jgi:glutamine cyclotransferase
MFRPMSIRVRTGTVLIAFIVTCAAGRLFAAGQSLTTAKGCKQMDVRVAKKLSVPRCYHEGLYYDGKAIWVSNGEGGKTWVIDTESGAVLSEIESVAGFTEAITAKGDGTYYTTEWYEKKVYHVTLDGNRLAVESSVSVAPSHPAGAVWNGSRLYVILWDRGIFGTKFSIIEMDEKMSIINKVQILAMQEPCQLAWDGAYLWMTSWYDQRAYKIDIVSWEAIAYFCTSLDRTTGIAWDGKYFWLTATYGDLYQMEVVG